MAEYNWSQGGQGALGGAATGAAVGSVVPGIGTGVGALVGGGIGALSGFGGSSSKGMPGYANRQAELNFWANNAQGRSTKTAYINPYERSAGGTDFRSGQMQLVKQLQQQAAGRGPSLASMQAQQAANASLAQQQALAAGAAPGNEALAARQAAMNAGGTMQNLAMTSAQARMAEQMAARQQLQGALGQGRGMDMQNEQFNAGMSNQRLLEQARMLQQNRQFNAGRNDQYELGMRDLELRNALGKQGGQAVNTMGTQMMSGGANLLAMYGMGQLGKPGAATMPQNNAGLDFNSLSGSYGHNGYTKVPG